MMVTANELLNSMLDDVPVHTHPVIDQDTYFVIDPVTRTISNASGTTNYVMQYDHASERFTFELPRIVEGHDMMLCNVVKVHYNNIDGESGFENADTYDVVDLRVDPKNSDNVLCSWLIDRQATQLAGTLSFIVHYACKDGDELVYEWYTDIFTDVTVKKGRNNGDPIAIEYSDILEQWRTRLFGSKDSLVSDLQAESAAQQANIEAKGAEILETIPEDYTTTHEMADKALRSKADAIILSETGERVSLDDSSDSNLVGLNIYGKTTQYHTTGKNLLKVSSDNVVIKEGYGDFTIANGNIYIADLSFFGIKMRVTYGTNYMISMKKNATSETCHIRVYEYTAEPTVVSSDDANYKMSAISKDCASKTSIVESYTPSGSDVTWISVGFYTTRPNFIHDIMVEIGSVATEYEPYSDLMHSPCPDWPQEMASVVNPELQIRGKNLLVNDFEPGHTEVKNGITFTFNEDGSIHVHGTPTAAIAFNIMSGVKFEAGHYTLSGAPESSSTKFRIQANKTVNGSEITGTYDTGGGSIMFIDHDGIAVRAYIYVAHDAGTVDGVFYPQIERGSVATEYEPYRGCTLTTSRTLYAVPVNQNGNYTDSNGQQWVCDEIDFERGKFVQRCYKETVSMWYDDSNSRYLGSLTYNADPNVANGHGIPVICDILPFNENATSNVNGVRVETTSTKFLIAHYDDEVITTVNVIYPIASPVETDLTTSELEAFRALYTNATDTIIFSDQNGPLTVKYIADIERYIYKNITYKTVGYYLLLKESDWVDCGDGRYYTQVLDIDARPNGEITLKPTDEQQLSLILDGIAMFVANDNGICTAYCIGGTPGEDMSIKADETVVVYA